MERLRFAPLIRVSTEKQKKKGESLATQEAQIRSYVDSLKGDIPEYCWRYKGQEHATPNQERALLDQLLEDAHKDIYDAVIVCDVSRWSRDNLKSKEGLQILRDNKIRFFAATMEFDLFNPEHIFYLGVAAEIGELQARQQSLKSITNRLKRAKDGRPASGRLPYGRTWSVENGWGIDAAKQLIIKQAARRYLNGESMPAIAASYGMNASNLNKLLTKRSGTDWPCKFVNHQTKKHEVIVMQIPPLLDANTIAQIHERIRNNKTYIRGNKKYNHLLQGHIYCRCCGLAMMSYRNHSGKDYYRHSRSGSGCNFHKIVPATLLENSVLVRLVQTFGDHEKVQQAIANSIPNLEQRERLSAEYKQLQLNMRRLENERDRLVDSVAKGLLKEDDVRKAKFRIDGNFRAIQFRLNSIDNELAHIPDVKTIKRAARLAVGIMHNITRNSPEIIFSQSYAWKRKLVEKAFGGVDSKGRRLGVYMDYVDSGWMFELRGVFMNTISALPMTDDDLVQAFHIEAEEYDEKLAYVKSNMFGKRHAYHLFGVHQ